MVEGAATGSFATLVNVVEEMAGAADPAARLSAAVAALRGAVHASAGLLLHGGPDGMDIRAIGPSAPPWSDGRLAPQVRVISGDDPLFDPILAGSTHVTTACRAFGQAAWQACDKRRVTLEVWDVDQVVVLPVRGGSEFVVFLLGRLGEDFTDEELELLTTLRPVISALVTILGPDLLPEPDTRVLRLTRRECTILTLLSHGHTAVRIGHLAGCSPRTVHHHLANIYAKLGVRDRLSAVNRARELRLVTPELVLAADGS